MAPGDIFKVSTGTLKLLRIEGKGKEKVYVFWYDADNSKYTGEVRQTENAVASLERFKIN